MIEPLPVRPYLRPPALSASAACMVGRSAREQLRRLLALNLDVELVVPIEPDDGARALLFSDAYAFCAVGDRREACCVIRRPDVRALLNLAFREGYAAAEPVTEAEMRVIDRIALAVVGSCAPVAGNVAGAGGRVDPAVAGERCGVYFELRVRAGLEAAVGLSLSAEPAPDRRALGIGALLDVTVDVRAEIGRARISVAQLGSLRAGSLIPLDTPFGEAGRLHAAGTTLAFGQPGASAGRNAFAVTRAGLAQP